MMERVIVRQAHMNTKFEDFLLIGPQLSLKPVPEVWQGSRVNFQLSRHKRLKIAFADSCRSFQPKLCRFLIIGQLFTGS
jgi:hypothetical protein